MATQYVILDTGQRNDRSTLVVHTEVPVGNNEVGTPWADALVESLGGAPITSQVPVSIMPGGRQAELDVGTRFEWRFTAAYDANDAPAAKLVVVESQISAREANELAFMQNELRFWGQTGSI